MSKTKGLLLLILAILVGVFAWENNQPTPPLKLFGLDLMVFPTFIIVYSCLLIGFAAGWVAHALRIKKKKRQAAAASVQTPEEPEPQKTQEAQ
ncbi:MAG: hypothetical protein FJ134_15455 [Deltaproteobacteria bacterium]|nr:hypothetical protein [Deltaproteobacteria bacterium]